MKICVDFGHGGSDPGAANRVVEKEITLSTGLELGKFFSFLGVEVIYTRTQDVNVSLAERAAIANRNGCDYFISVHSNAGGGRGIETYAYSVGGKGEALAKKVQAQLIGYTGMVDRGVKIANFAVLRETVMPAILIENGFTDTDDAEIIKTIDHIHRFAAAVTKGFCEYAGLAWKDMYAPPAPAVDEEKEQLKARIAELERYKAGAEKDFETLRNQLLSEQNRATALENSLGVYREWVVVTKKVLSL